MPVVKPELKPIRDIHRTYHVDDSLEGRDYLEHVVASDLQDALKKDELVMRFRNMVPLASSSTSWCPLPLDELAQYLRERL